MISIEDYVQLVSGETEPTDEQKTLAQKIFDAVEEDVKGLKAVNAQLKAEKTKDKEKFKYKVYQIIEIKDKYLLILRALF